MTGDEIRALVETKPGWTSAELAAHTGIDRYTMARRLPEAARRFSNGTGVYRGPARACRVSKRMAMTWWPEPIE